MSHLSKEAFWLGDLNLSIPVSPGLYINTRLLLGWLWLRFSSSPRDERHRQQVRQLVERRLTIRQGSKKGGLSLYQVQILCAGFDSESNQSCRKDCVLGKILDICG